MTKGVSSIEHLSRGIGLGGSVNETTDTGPGAAMTTQVNFRYLQEAKEVNPNYDYYGRPLVVAEFDAWYNIIGANQEGLTTAIRGRGFIGVGHQFLETGEQGFDVYVLPSLVLDGGLAYHEYSANEYQVGVGVETGGIGRVGDVLMMVSPIVMVGSSANVDIRNGGSNAGRTEFLEFGGRGRIASMKRTGIAYASVEAVYSPTLDEYVNRKQMWDGLRLTASGTFNLTDKWGFNLYAQRKSYDGATPQSADYAETGAGVTLLRRW